MKLFLLFSITFLAIFERCVIVEACMATSSASDPVISSTVSPSSSTVSPSSSTVTPLNVCSPELITYGVGDGGNPEFLVDVTYSGLTSTQIGNTQETTSTLTVSCAAIDGYNVYMMFNVGQGGPQENMNFPQNIDITLTCDSRAEVWVYSAVVGGETFTRDVMSVRCQQVANIG
uniref:C6 domain-containing protein n=2 Tax=Caenorhabditis tropicalis TaxID=1561998 RepID=A0A1I7UVH9_9PELO